MSKEKIPKGWGIFKVKDIFDRVRNPVEVIKDEKYTQIGIRSHGKGIFYKEAVTGEQLGNKSVFWIEPDCFIVNIVFAWEMAVARTTDKDRGYIASHRFPMYRPKKGVLDLDFITYLFKSPRGIYLLNLASPGGAGRNKTLGQKEFEEVELLLPIKIEEQQKIASILFTWDKAIELKEKLIEQKKEQKKGLMQKLLAGEANLKGYEGEWEDYEVQEICELGRGRVISKKEISKNIGEYPVFSSQTLNNGEIGRINTYDFEGEYITWTTDGANAGTVFYRNGKFNCTNVCGVLKLKKESIDARYFAYVLQENTNKYVVRHGNPKLMNNIMAIISIKIFNNLKYQNYICDIFDVINKDILLNELNLKELQLQKKALMQQLLTGKIRVKV